MSSSPRYPSPSEIAAGLGKPRDHGDGYMACCPAHDDKNPSLSLSTGQNGRTVWKCFAGCSQEAVQDAMHRMGLWPYPSSGGAVRSGSPSAALAPVSSSVRREHVTSYHYTDEHGVPVLRVDRGIDHFADGKARKTFRQWCYAKDVPDPSPLPKGFRRDGDWITGAGVLKDMRRVLYNLPSILAEPGRRVFVTEGEKDADTLTKLGLLATTKPEGVIKSATGPDAERWRPVFTDTLVGRHVAILPDNDDPGRRHAKILASWLHPVCASVRIVDLSGLPPSGDISDWHEAGGTREQLEQLVKATPVYVPDPGLPSNDADSDIQGPASDVPPQPKRLHGRREVTDRRLNVIVGSDVIPETVRWWWKDWLPVGKVVVLDGDPGLGKSGLTLEVAARITTGRPMPDGSTGDVAGPATVLLCAHEDGLADTIIPRFLSMGGQPSRLHYLDDVTEKTVDGTQERRVPFTVPDDLDALSAYIADTRAVLAIIDPWMAYLSGEKDSHRDQDMRSVLREVADIAQETGCTILLVRHLNKASGDNVIYRGNGSIGIIGAVRIAWFTAPDPDDEDGKNRILAVAKTNLSERPVSLRYRQVGMPDKSYKVEWLGESAHTATSLATAQAPHAERSAHRPAAQFLRETLAGGPCSAKVVESQAKAKGISEKVLRTACDEIGVVKRRHGFGAGGEWTWGLPDTTIDAQPPIDAHRRPPSRDQQGRASMDPEGIYVTITEDVNIDLGFDDAPFGEPLRPIATAPMHDPGVGSSGTGPVLRCEINECYAPANARHHGQLLCFRHHPMGTSAPSLLTGSA